MDIINRLEPQVRTYVRSFPKTFTTAQGNRMTDADLEDRPDIIDEAVGSVVEKHGLAAAQAGKY